MEGVFPRGLITLQETEIGPFCHSDSFFSLSRKLLGQRQAAAPMLTQPGPHLLPGHHHPPYPGAAPKAGTPGHGRGREAEAEDPVPGEVWASG